MLRLFECRRKIQKGKIEDKCWYLLFYYDTLMKNQVDGRSFEHKQKRWEGVYMKKKLYNIKCDV